MLTLSNSLHHVAEMFKGRVKLGDISFNHLEKFEVYCIPVCGMKVANTGVFFPTLYNKAVMHSFI